MNKTSSLQDRRQESAVTSIHWAENIENKISSSMPILEATTDGNGCSDKFDWVRSILQEKEKQINNCDLHDQCIPTQKLKVMLEEIYLYVCIYMNVFPNIISILTENNCFHLFLDSSRMPSVLFDTQTKIDCTSVQQWAYLVQQMSYS